MITLKYDSGYDLVFRHDGVSEMPSGLAGLNPDEPGLILRNASFARSISENRKKRT